MLSPEKLNISTPAEKQSRIYLTVVYCMICSFAYPITRNTTSIQSITTIFFVLLAFATAIATAFFPKLGFITDILFVAPWFLSFIDAPHLISVAIIIFGLAAATFNALYGFTKIPIMKWLYIGFISVLPILIYCILYYNSGSAIRVWFMVNSEVISPAILLIPARIIFSLRTNN